MTKTTIEFPYVIEQSGDFRSSMKQECVKYLNRLVEVVRYRTRKYWIGYVSGRDIIHVKFKIEDEQGNGRSGFKFDSGKGFELTVQMFEESEVKAEILSMLEQEQRIPSYENLILDSFNYYSTGRFNEAIILMNIALEELVKEVLFRKLIDKHKLSQQEAGIKISQIFSHRKKQKKTGMHKVMTVDFKEVGGRSLEEFSDLWHKFNSVRIVRKNVMHPTTKIISLDSASYTIQSLLEIMQWTAV